MKDGLRVLTPAQALPLYRALWRKGAPEYVVFPGFRFFNEKLWSGDFRVLRNRFDLRVFAYSVAPSVSSASASSDDCAPAILATHYRARSGDWGEPHTLGSILIDPRLPDEELSNFRKALADALGSVESLLAPFNGHPSLGLSLPDPGVDPRQIAFLTSASTPALGSLFFSPEAQAIFIRERRYFALELRKSEEAIEKFKDELSRRPPRVRTRALSVRHFKRDILIYNQLVNACMKGHPFFHPLAPEEEWELMWAALPLIHPAYFRFLLHDDREIGFCFGIADYNPYLSARRSDARNFLSALAARNSARKGRVIYSGILPEYRGERLFKFVRHEVLLAMFGNGIEQIESSYIDEGNQNSLGNVRSTGAGVSHTFSLFRLKLAGS